MKAKKTFIFKNTNDIHIIKFKKRRWWWLLFLLLLLPLILLIPFKKNFDIKVINSVNNEIISNAYVQFSYTNKELFDFSKTQFFSSDTIKIDTITNNSGIASFNNVRYTLYHWLFFHRARTIITAESNCMASDTIMPQFYDLHKEPPTIIKLGLKLYNLDFLVIDIEDKQPLPDAEVEIIINDILDNSRTEIIKTNESGIVFIKNIPYCSDITVKASLWGYNDTILKSSTQYIIGNPSPTDEIEKRTLPLRPIKDIVQFYVKSAVTKQPIPGATCTGYFDKNGNLITKTTVTNINGVGKILGEFKDIHIIMNIKIKAEHPYYYPDSIGYYKVDDFLDFNEEQRTIYLRPREQCITFRNTLNAQGGSPLEGVTNQIIVNGNSFGIETSNSAGYFTVCNLTIEDIITINSSKPDYISNQRTIQNIKISDLVNYTNPQKDIPLQKEPPPTKNYTLILKRCHTDERDKYNVYVDGNFIGRYDSGDKGNPLSPITFPLQLIPGKHIIKLEISTEENGGTCGNHCKIEIPSLLTEKSINRSTGDSKIFQWEINVPY